MFRNIRIIALIVFFTTSLFSFQNCSPPPVSVVQSSALGIQGTPSPGTQAFQKYTPVLAVRGMNCVACHGSISSGIVTDFGFTPNLSNPPNGQSLVSRIDPGFATKQLFSISDFAVWNNSQTVNGSAFPVNLSEDTSGHATFIDSFVNDGAINNVGGYFGTEVGHQGTAFGNSGNSWQTMTVTGNLVVPSQKVASFAVSDLKNIFGITHMTATSGQLFGFADVVQYGSNVLNTSFGVGDEISGQYKAGTVALQTGGVGVGAVSVDPPSDYTVSSTTSFIRTIADSNGVDHTLFVPGPMFPTGTQSGNTNQVISSDNIVISYPTKAQILTLAGFAGIPATATAAVMPLQNVTGAYPTGAISSISGLVAGGGTSSKPAYISNGSNSQVSCNGDVIIQGVLFLDNVTVNNPDGNGCRLYVSQSVFIQGALLVPQGNLQISSASAILLGFSNRSLGLADSTTAPADQGHIYDSTIRTYMGAAVPAGNAPNPNIPSCTTPTSQYVGGPWPRFSAGLDPIYSPTGMVNQVPRAQFFDQIVADGASLNGQLLDAGDSQSQQFIPTSGSNPSNLQWLPEVGDCAAAPGSRLHVDYQHLLLNAPHVHSRYGGNFSGVIIAEVAYLARNYGTDQTKQQLVETFTYDDSFSTIYNFLPALTTPLTSYNLTSMLNPIFLAP